MGVGLLWRVLAVLAVFVGCGLFVAKLVIAHAQAGGAPLAQVRLAGWMAGLFAGGALASVVVLALAFGKRR